MALSLLVASATFAPHSAGLLYSRPVAKVSRDAVMSDVTTGQVHGEGGAYVGGYWVPLEDCPVQFNIAGGSNEQAVRAERSRTGHSAAKLDGTYDVAIVGGGCIGAAIARELAKTDASVVLFEAADDVSQGATKGNSGIVHAGYDDTPGTMRAKLCWKGNQMFPDLDRELHFGTHTDESPRPDDVARPLSMAIQLLLHRFSLSSSPSRFRIAIEYSALALLCLLYQ
eukprot:6208569-Pleurochrysis_carterae.AAC.1